MWRRWLTNHSLLLCGTSVLLLWAFVSHSGVFLESAFAQGPLSGSQILAQAPERIERHRKADATVTVLDPQGRPVPDAQVSITQKRHTFLFGCNIFNWGRIEDPQLQEAYLTKFADLLNYATLPFYWAAYEFRPGEPNHAYTEKVARWCQEHGILTKGHPLAWNHADPAWLPEDPDEVYRLQLARIEDCVSRFRGLIDRWDVVNEPTHFNRDEFLRTAPKLTAAWSKRGQLEFTRECFLQARKASPDAILLVNDYRIDPAYERVIEGLVDESGKPLYDAIGIQSHMHGGPWSIEQTWEVCERFSRFGVPLHFTETTILSGPRPPRGGPRRPPASTPEGEGRQAEEVTRFYTVLFSHPAVEAITWWDFSDFRSWQGAPAGLLRRDMSPKPAYEALYELIKGRWWTQLECRTDPQGAAKFRGFLGDYRVVVTTAAGERVEQEFTLAKGQENLWEIRLK